MEHTHTHICSYVYSYKCDQVWVNGSCTCIRFLNFEEEYSTLHVVEVKTQNLCSHKFNIAQNFKIVVRSLELHSCKVENTYKASLLFANPTKNTERERVATFCFQGIKLHNKIMLCKLTT